MVPALLGDSINGYFLRTKAVAELGDAEAQNSVGACYENGEGVDRNPSDALNWYRKAAEQGFAPAQMNLARYYVKLKKYVEAYKWVSLAPREIGAAELQSTLQRTITPAQKATADRFIANFQPHLTANQGYTSYQTPATGS
jgi:Sel1 repeat